LNNLAINDKYKSLWTTDKTLSIVTGGRGSGKTFSTIIFLIYLSFERGNNIFFTRWEMSNAEKSIIPSFLNILEVLGLTHHFKVTKNELINKKTGGIIRFAGLKASSTAASLDNLKGLDIFNIAVLDEAFQLQSADLFNALSLSIRRNDVQNRVIVLLNPGHTEHFIYKDYIEEPSDNINYIHTTFEHNKDNLPDDFFIEIEELRLKDYEKYRQVVLGEWGALNKNRFYRNFKPDEHITEYEYNPKLPLYISIDDNTIPYAHVLLGQVIGDTIYFFDEIAIFQANQQKVIREFNNRYRNHQGKLFFTADATSNKGSSLLEKGDSFNKIFYRAIECKNKENIVPRSNPSILDRSAWCNSILAGLEDVQIRVTKGCPRLIDDYEQLMPQMTGSDTGKKSKAIYNDTKNDCKYQKYGHASDNQDYMLFAIWKEEFLTYTRGEQSNPITININKPNRY